MSEQIRVAYQGEPGAFSQAAAKRLLNGTAATMPFASFEEMFESVVAGEADCCVTPIENSLAGSIHRNYDLLLESKLEVRGETNLRIAHNVIAAPGVDLGEVRRVYSHPVALAQCGRFLRARPGIEVVPVHDTAGAVRLVMERGEREAAAIASDTAATIYGASILARGVEDNPQNFTRFLLAAPAGAAIRTADEGSSRRWKTSLLLRIPNTPGSLFKTLGIFALDGIDLSKIESRPIEGKPWEYAFYVDVIGNADSEPLARALATLRQCADSVTVMGSYQTRW